MSSEYEALPEPERRLLLEAASNWNGWEHYTCTTRKHRLPTARKLVAKGLLEEHWVTLCDVDGELRFKDERESRCFKPTAEGLRIVGPTDFG